VRKSLKVGKHSDFLLSVLLAKHFTMEYLKEAVLSVARNEDISSLTQKDLVY
jgi:hypothetical protein